MAWELVALVSSCQALPWMMLVTLSFEYCRTRFQTLITSPQVVSTNRQPLASSCCRIETSVPKAGMMTMSSFFKSCDVGVLLLAGEELDAHGADLVVHLGVVDDLAEDINRLIGKDLAGGVGQVNGPLDAVAEAEFLGQLDGQIAGREHMAAGANALDQVAAIMRQHLGLDRRHDIRAAEIDLLRRRGRFG